MNEIEVMGRKEMNILSSKQLKQPKLTQCVEQSAEFWKSHLISPVQIVIQRVSHL